jgi:TrmH family RNA methyltransferase
MWDQPASLGDHVLLLDQIQDPGNVGTIIRTAHSFGYDCVVLSENSVDLTNEKVLRASQGAIFHLPVIQRAMKSAVEECRKNGLMILGTGLKHSVPLSTIPDREKVAIILGNEGQGVRFEILHLCDAVVKIEINGFESLNVAVASGILCYRFRKP